jgi:hypothetical protein
MVHQRSFFSCLLAAACLAVAFLSAQTAVQTAAAGEKAAENKPKRRGAMPQGLTTNMVRVAPDRFELPVGKRVKEKPVLPDMQDGDPLIDVNGTVLTWGAMKRTAELSVSDVRLPVGVTVEDFEAERDTLLMRNVYKLAKSFIRKTVLAQEATRRGLKVEADEFAARQAALAADMRKLGKKGDAYIKESTTPGSYVWQEVTHTALMAKLRDDSIRSSVTVSEAEIEDYIAKCAKENEANAVYNKGLRPKLEGLLKRIRAGEETFADAAFKESDCDSSVDYGEMGIVKCEDLLPELVEALSKLEDGGLSDVVETPYSYHILKLNKKNLGFLKKGDPGPAPVVAFHFAHIMLERKEPKPVPTKEQARGDVRDLKVKKEMGDLEKKLVAEAKITTPLKLFDTPPTK